MSQIVSGIVCRENKIYQLFLNKKIGSLPKRCKIDKQKRISPVAVFLVLFTRVFTAKSLFLTLEADGICGMAKETGYRFLNSVHTSQVIPLVLHTWGTP